jgi:hypothetical protein
VNGCQATGGDAASALGADPRERKPPVGGGFAACGDDFLVSALTIQLTPNLNLNLNLHPQFHTNLLSSAAIQN